MELLTKYFPSLTPEQTSRFEKLDRLYRYWNSKINVISRKDIEHLYEHHVLHSLSIVKKYPFAGGSTVLDAGTGGGFPGIPLAILFPDVTFSLIDATGKKIKVVEEIRQALDLSNIRTIHGRLEEHTGKYQCVTGRAISEFVAFVKLVSRHLVNVNSSEGPNGILYLKGGSVQDEKQHFPSLEITPLSEIFSEEYFITKKLIYLPAHSMKRQP